MGAIKVVVISIVSIFIIINITINENLRDKILSILNKKIFKTKISITNLLVLATILIIIGYSVSLLSQTKENLDFINEDVSEQEENLKKAKEIIEIQSSKYNELMKIETNIENCKNPYIPDGFIYIDGGWDTGFIIEDEKGNQFVWVPCSNIENNEQIPILKKETFAENSINYFNCYEQDNFEDFIKSSLENGSFYISRFEIGNENRNPVSKQGKEIWNNVTWKKAKEISENMYSNINSKLINGYAFDTAVKFIFNEIDLNNVPKSSKITGNKAYKNIYDLVDDNLEWTSEMRYTSYLNRGSIFDEKGNKPIFFSDRFSGDEKTTLENLGFRTIIYR